MSPRTKANAGLCVKVNNPKNQCQLKKWVSFASYKKKKKKKKTHQSSEGKVISWTQNAMHQTQIHPSASIRKVRWGQDVSCSTRFGRCQVTAKELAPTAVGTVGFGARPGETEQVCAQRSVNASQGWRASHRAEERREETSQLISHLMLSCDRRGGRRLPPLQKKTRAQEISSFCLFWGYSMTKICYGMQGAFRIL